MVSNNLNLGKRLIALGKVQEAIKIFNLSLKYLKHSKRNAKEYIKIGETFYN